jgi:outer membrane cobalamin receptor
MPIEIRAAPKSHLTAQRRARERLSGEAVASIPLFRPRLRISAGWLAILTWLLIATGTEIECRASQAPQDPQAAAPLKLLSLEELGNIEVTTVSKEPEEVWKTPAAISVLTKEDIRRSGATSIPEALRLVPGVEVERIDANTWAVGVRGFGSQFSQSVLVLIDGRNVYTPLFAGVNWRVQNVMLEDVARMEVIRGPGGAIWEQTR